MSMKAIVEWCAITVSSSWIITKTTSATFLGLQCDTDRSIGKKIIPPICVYTAALKSLYFCKIYV